MTYNVFDGTLNQWTNVNHGWDCDDKCTKHQSQSVHTTHVETLYTWHEKYIKIKTTNMMTAVAAEINLLYIV